jgi:syntaxin-binding protein 1
MRLLMIYLLFKEGIWEQDLKLLLHHTDLAQRGYDLPLRNIDCIIPFRIYQTHDEYKAALKSKSRKRPKAPQGDEEAFELSRYIPPLKMVLEELVNGTLDAQTWAYTVEQPPETQPTGQQGSLRTYFLERKI